MRQEPEAGCCRGQDATIPTPSRYLLAQKILLSESRPLYSGAPKCTGFSVPPYVCGLSGCSTIQWDLDIPNIPSQRAGQLHERQYPLMMARHLLRVPGLLPRHGGIMEGTALSQSWPHADTDILSPRGLTSYTPPAGLQDQRLPPGSRYCQADPESRGTSLQIRLQKQHKPCMPVFDLPTHLGSQHSSAFEMPSSSYGGCSMLVVVQLTSHNGDLSCGLTDVAELQLCQISWL